MSYRYTLISSYSLLIDCLQVCNLPREIARWRVLFLNEIQSIWKTVLSIKARSKHGCGNEVSSKFSSFIALCFCLHYVFGTKMNWVLYLNLSPAHIFKDFCLRYVVLWLRFGGMVASEWKMCCSTLAWAMQLSQLCRKLFLTILQMLAAAFLLSECVAPSLSFSIFKDQAADKTRNWLSYVHTPTLGHCWRVPRTADEKENIWKGFSLMLWCCQHTLANDI